MQQVKFVDLSSFPGAPKDVMGRLLQLDDDAFGHLKNEDRGDLNYWLKIKNKSSFHFLAISRGEIIGYMHLVSLNANGLSLLNRGLLREGQILDAIMSKRAKRLNLYVIAVVVQKGFRRKGIAKKLWDVSRRYFLANQFYVNGIYGTVWTRAGRRLMERFSAQKLGRDRLGHEMVFIWTVDGKMLKLGDSKK